MDKNFQKKFSHLITELRALKENYGHEINEDKDAEVDFEVGVSCLEDSLKALQKRDQEENEPPTREEAEDAYREECATKGAD